MSARVEPAVGAKSPGLDLAAPSSELGRSSAEAIDRCPRAYGQDWCPGPLSSQTRAGTPSFG
jgi:hypothetical protein